ncbi:hypothetical protein Pmani_009609 [Petrolisthes manimaculis]|uniref:Uncharacterized protein n=1 Tax=Petrolisthes manimaculis TaxID=1843537 RepID=A0AAE1Q6M9_9EUCA|nr:hypothetical protein Pmani_009609 [Petrolisthes manimaculis]
MVLVVVVVVVEMDHGYPLVVGGGGGGVRQHSKLTGEVRGTRGVQCVASHQRESISCLSLTPSSLILVSPWFSRHRFNSACV